MLEGSNAAPPHVAFSSVTPPMGSATSYLYEDSTVLDPTSVNTNSPYAPLVASTTFNSQGLPQTSTISGSDPMNGDLVRTTTINYASNGLDVTSVVNNKSETVYTVNSYNDFHQPTSITDGLGHSAELTYKDWGAPSTITTHETETSTDHVTT